MLHGPRRDVKGRSALRHPSPLIHDVDAAPSRLTAGDLDVYFVVAVDVNAPSLALLTSRLSPYEMMKLDPSVSRALTTLLDSDDRLTYAVAPCEATTAHWLLVIVQSSMCSSAVGP